VRHVLHVQVHSHGAASRRANDGIGPALLISLLGNVHRLIKVVIRQRGVDHLATTLPEERGLKAARLRPETVEIEDFHGCGTSADSP
jgi:hypothetical protein